MSDQKAPANAQLLSTVLIALPYTHLMSDIDMHSSPDVLRFTWRGTRYRVSETFGVDEVGDGVLIGSDKAILLERLLKVAHYSNTVIPA